MKKALYHIILWAPRALGLPLIAYVFLLVPGLFRDRCWFTDTPVEEMILLIPSLNLTAIWIVSWRKEWVGGILFTALGALFVCANWGKCEMPVLLLIMAGPLLLTGLSYLLSWFCGAARRRAA